MIDPLEIIGKYYRPGSLAYEMLVGHGRAVAGKSLKIARKMPSLFPDQGFIEEAAMLHDIGIFLTDAPGIGCHGEKPYICHGYLGRELLEREGLPRHGLVCERHVGVGITIPDIRRYNLPLPAREMLPVTLEERIICYADKFFSKKSGALDLEKSADDVRASIRKYGEEKLLAFEELHSLFSR